MSQEEKIDELSRYLENYLRELGCYENVNKGGNIHCPIKEHHKHGDKNPSAKIDPNTKEDHPVLTCFTSGNRYDIFDLFHEIEGLPISGKEFYTVTCQKIADKYDVEYEPDISEAEIRKITARSLYSDVIDYISYNDKEKYSQWDDTVGFEIINKKGWSEKTLKWLKIGIIDSYERLINYLTNKLDWTENDLAEYNLIQHPLGDPPTVFADGNLCYPIFDKDGHPVGFASKNARFIDSSSTEKTGPKYYNSRTSEIFKKGNHLYNLNNIVLGNAAPLYIVEGYSDVATLWDRGMHSVIGLMGKSMTIEQAELIEEFHDVVLIPDGDAGGRGGVSKNYNNIIQTGDHNVKIKHLPDGYDPDRYVQENSKKAFFDVKNYKYFEWELRFDSSADDPIKIAKNAIPTIVNEPNYLKKMEYISALSKVTGLDKLYIKNEVDRRVNAEKMEIKDDLKSRFSNLYWGVKKGKTTVSEAIDKLTAEKSAKLSHAERDTINFKKIYSNTLEKERQKMWSGQINDGFSLGKFGYLEKVSFDGGIPKNGKFMILAGIPNSGKSSFLRNIGIEMAMNNNDICVIYFITDDSVGTILPPILSTIEGVPIRYFKNKMAPYKFGAKMGDDWKVERRKDNIPKVDRSINRKLRDRYGISVNEMRTRIKKKFKDAWEKLRTLKKDGKLFLFDTRSSENEINSSNIENVISDIYDAYPNKNLFVMLDSLNKLDSDLAYSSIREKVKHTSKVLENITRDFDIPLIATAESRKLKNTRRAPGLHDIAEARNPGHDADLVLLCHNDLHAKRMEVRDTEKLWDPETYSDYENIWLLDGKEPLLDIIFAKNKITEFKGKVTFRFLSKETRILPWDPAEDYKRE